WRRFPTNSRGTTECNPSWNHVADRCALPDGYRYSDFHASRSQGAARRPARRQRRSYWSSVVGKPRRRGPWSVSRLSRYRSWNLGRTTAATTTPRSAVFERSWRPLNFSITTPRSAPHITATYGTNSSKLARRSVPWIY